MKVFACVVAGAFTAGFFFGDAHGFLDGLMVASEVWQ